jgi:hypothetical protein
MQLRTHPCLFGAGVYIWPPLWSRVSGKAEIPVGEVGILEVAYPSAVTGTKCFLLIQHEESRFLGTLEFSDSDCRKKICEFLRRHCGQPLQLIGDLDADAG